MNNEYLAVQDTFPLNGLSISSSVIGFFVSSDASVNGTVTIPATPASAGGQPVIAVSNFSGVAQLSWPSTMGGQYYPLLPGDPVTLTDFAG